jgi:hypothetical protein
MTVAHFPPCFVCSGKGAMGSAVLVEQEDHTPQYRIEIECLDSDCGVNLVTEKELEVALDAYLEDQRQQGNLSIPSDPFI